MKKEKKKEKKEAKNEENKGIESGIKLPKGMLNVPLPTFPKTPMALPKAPSMPKVETLQEPKQLISIFSELCVVCKKKKCFYSLVTQEGRESITEIHAICSEHCAQKFRQMLKDKGCEKATKEILTVVRDGYYGKKF